MTVVDEGGVTPAARRLRVAQPSISQALRTTERELGVELFHRLGRGLKLSPAGEALVGPAREALRRLQTIRDVAAGAAGVAAGRLDLATLPTLAIDPLAYLIGRFRRSYPGVAVSVLEPNTPVELTTLLRQGSCEVALTHLPLTQRELMTHSLGSQELLLVLPPDTDIGPGPVRAEELGAMPLVVTPPATSTRTLLEQALKDVGAEANIAVETAAREATIPLVLEGAGCALLPTPLARDAELRGALVRRVDPPISRLIGAVYRPGRLSAAAVAFLELAAAHVDEAP